MRVLFWSENFWPYIGGVGVLGAKLLPALKERGYEFLVVTSHDFLRLPDEERYRDIPIRRFPFLSALRDGDVQLLTGIFHELTRLKRNFKPDLVHVNALGLHSLFHLQTLHAYPSPMLVTLHQKLLNDDVRPATIQGRTLRLADWINCCSEDLLVALRRLLPEAASRSSVIHNGIEAPSRSPGPVSFDEPKLLCLGRLTPEKGFDLALSAFASIIGRFPRVRMVIAGDGPERARLEQQAAALGLNESVDFLGWVAPDHVASLMGSSTIVVLPSRREGLPLAVLESALMARPIVAARVGGVPEIITDQETGLLFAKEDVAALSEKLALLLSHPEVAIQLGETARRRVQERFSFERFVDRYDVVYRKVVGRTCRTAAN
jgi:glycosyltransferase involved in cell wall biosynthesis